MLRLISILALAQLAACATTTARPHRAADPEEYAVWGAALDAASGRMPRLPVVVASEARAMAADSFTVRSVREGAWLGVREEMIPVFFSTDSPAMRVDRAALGRHTRVPLLRPGGDGDVAAAAPDNAVARVSRVAFDATRTRALVHVWWGCGMLCGNGGVVLMEKDARGRWRVKHHLTMVFS